MAAQYKFSASSQSKPRPLHPYTRHAARTTSSIDAMYKQRVRVYPVVGSRTAYIAFVEPGEVRHGGAVPCNFNLEQRRPVWNHRMMFPQLDVDAVITSIIGSTWTVRYGRHRMPHVSLDVALLLKYPGIAQYQDFLPRLSEAQKAHFSQLLSSQCATRLESSLWYHNMAWHETFLTWYPLLCFVISSLILSGP